MRILAGESKGKPLKTRDGNGTRPTDSRTREMLFNIIGARIIDIDFLDLYAGSGAIGLEALSRGARSCVFVEQNAVACAVIKENARALGYLDRVQVWRAAVKPSIKRLVDDEKRFGIVFADPPFDRSNELKEVCATLDTAGQLLHNLAGQNADQSSDADALLIIQHHRRALPSLPARFEMVRERRAGESTLSFFLSKSPALETSSAPESAAVSSHLNS